MIPEHNQIELVKGYVQEMWRSVRQFGIYTRNSAPYLSDHVTFALLSKAFSLADAALVLVEKEHPEESLGLTRSLVECASNLRYLTQDPDQFAKRALAFAQFFFKERQYWLYQAREFLADQQTLADLAKYAKDEGIVPDPSAASGHWSGLRGFIWEVAKMSHPLDGAAYGLKHRKIEYALEYRQTSAYVHCSFPAIDRMVPEEGVVYEPILHSEGREQEGQKTLYTTVQYLYFAVRYTLFALKVDDASSVATLYQKTLSELHPIRRQHRP